MTADWFYNKKRPTGNLCRTLFVIYAVKLKC